MVLTEIDINAILVEPTKNRTSGEMMRAYQTLIDRLAKAMIFPKLHILDNECSQDFKQKIESNGMKYQLVPPNDHRRNIAEKAIQTFKDHFVSILCGTDKTYYCTYSRTHHQHRVPTTRNRKTDHTSHTQHNYGTHYHAH